MKPGPAILCLTMLMGTLIVPLTVDAFQQDSNSAISAGLEESIQVFRLKYARAEDVEAMLNGLHWEAAFAADAHSNSIIVRSVQEQLDQIKTIISSLDVLPKRQPSENTVFESFSLKHSDPQDALSILQSMLEGLPDVRMDADRKSGQIHISAPAHTCEMVGELLSRLDERAEINSVDSVYVMLSLVVEGIQVGGEQQDALRQPDAEMQSILNEAKENGLFSFEDPAIVTRMVTQVQCASNAPNSGDEQGFGRLFESVSQETGSGYIVYQSGNLKQRDDGKLHLETEIKIGIHPNESHDISTGVVAPLDHPVVLTFSSINGIPTAVVLKLVAAGH